mgnify:CR=1 FL=1
MDANYGALGIAIMTPYQRQSDNNNSLELQYRYTDIK